jgi:hypothetical protein
MKVLPVARPNSDDALYDCVDCDVYAETWDEWVETIAHCGNVSAPVVWDFVLEVLRPVEFENRPRPDRVDC